MSKDKLIELALSEVGYLEKSAEAYRKDPSILYKKKEGAGYDNYTKYGHEMHKVYPQTMDFPAYWCDAFVDWLFYKTFGVATAKNLLGGFDDYTVSSAKKYSDRNAYFKGTKGILPGDQIFFKNSERINHTGIVVAIDDRTIYTVEGNTSPQKKEASVDPNGGGVWIKEYPYGYERIDGYGRPPYDKYVKKEYPCWIHSDGYWYYRIAEGRNAHGWAKINGHWYYFLENGRMVTGANEIESETHGIETYYFIPYGDCEGALMHTNDRGALIIWDV